MKVILESHRDYLFVVRLILASIHEPRKLNEIIDAIDGSAVDRKIKIGVIAGLFTVKEIKELRDKSGEIYTFAEKYKNKRLFDFIEGYYILSDGILHLRKMRKVKEPMERLSVH